MEAYQELEKEWRRFAESSNAISCSSGTAALHLALLSLGIGPGDEVIIPDFTMAAVAFAVSYTGATPVFADVSLDHYGIETTQIEKLTTERTKAVIVVHTYGRIVPMEPILALAKKLNIRVIEDACEAQGAIKASKADLTCYSFYRNKIVAAEEGGMITTEDKALAERIAYLKNMAFSPAHDYFHEEVGYNYRMPNEMAKMALVSLHLYPKNAKQRRKIERWYEERLPDPFSRRHAVWFYEYPGTREIIKKVKGARLPFKPLSSFPVYEGGRGRPNARVLSENLILLPVRPEMTEKDVDSICEAVRTCANIPL